MPKKADTSHIICDPETDGFKCRNCGAVWIPELPLLSGIFLRKLKAFQDFHTDCTLKTEEKPTDV